MSSIEYLTELRSYLDTLPDAECEAAVAFYSNEFDKGDSETSVMLRLGNPYSLAKRIIAESSDFNDSSVYRNLKKDGMTNAVFPKVDYKEPEKEILPKVKTAYDKLKPSYSSPPPPKYIKSEKRTKGVIIGVFIAVFATAFFFLAIGGLVGLRSYQISHQAFEEAFEDTAMPVHEIIAETNVLDETVLPSSPVINSISIDATNTDVTFVYGDSYIVEHSGSVDISNYGERVEITGNGGEIRICITDDIDNLNIVMTGGSLTTADHDISNLTLNLTGTEIFIIG
ncbi:MAG: DUF1700 domain-containing protein [Ruminococcus sp.]|jgi:hypothetical protein|nr:DUF1700 domain-containing protein [Ruminococcus sp.]